MSRRRHPKARVVNPSDAVLTAYCTDRGNHAYRPLARVDLRIQPDGTPMLAYKKGTHNPLKPVDDGRLYVDERCASCGRHIQWTSATIKDFLTRAAGAGLRNIRKDISKGATLPKE